jgi:hypothetical protein
MNNEARQSASQQDNSDDEQPKKREQVTVEDSRDKTVHRFSDGTQRVDLKAEGLDPMSFGSARWRGENEEVGQLANPDPLFQEMRRRRAHPRGWMRFERSR